MAKYNEILVGRFNNALKKVFGMKGPAPSPQLASELAATIQLYYGVENRFLEEWHRFTVVNTATGGAGQVAGVRFRNPTGANVAAVFEKILVGATAADNISLLLQARAADLTTVNSITGSRIDNRGKPTPAMINSQTTNFGALSGNVDERCFLAVNSNYDFVLYENQELTLLPGDAIDIVSGTNAALLTVSWIWRERFLEDSERQ